MTVGQMRYAHDLLNGFWLRIHYYLTSDGPFEVTGQRRELHWGHLREEAFWIGMSNQDEEEQAFV